MAELLVTNPESLAMLYGDTFYVHPSDMGAPTAVATPAIPVTPVQNVTPPQIEVTAPNPQVPKTRLEPVQDTSHVKPGITWRTKPNSKVLFVLQISEFKNPELTEFLKKIVDSLGIPSEFVGFGQIDGQVHLEEFDHIPNPYAVVFDTGVWGGADNPVKLGKGEIFFTESLANLQHQQDLKRLLWGHLKQLKEKLI